MHTGFTRRHYVQGACRRQASELIVQERLGVNLKHFTPYHPRTCGKVERFHKTLSRYLTKQPAPHTVAELQLRHDTFRSYYNQRRPLTLCYLSRLRHIAVGRAHKHQPVTLLGAGRHVHVVAEDGSLLRELPLDPARDYQPLGTPPGRPGLGHHDVRQVATIS